MKAALLWSFVARTQKLGERERWFSLASHTCPPLPYFSPRKKGHALNGPHTTATGAARIMFKQRRGACRAAHKMTSPNLHFIRQSLCYRNEYSFMIAGEEDAFGSTLRESIVVIITSESSAPARGESLCFSCCRQSISARGKHSAPLLLSAEEL